MTSTNKPSLPPNPYSRQPIRKREQLAGRGKELKAIRYYLGLTAAGQSPHLALIGQRGVGKTSLLNGTEATAADLKLLPVRLDMNEQKVRSPGEFWHDLYATLILALAKVGCWGGLQGNLYADLFQMLYSKQHLTKPDRIVLQIPYAFSCHQGELRNFLCSDALVVHDFKHALEELKHHGYAGIVLLIDEADCIGQNVPLLQMFRNIFQIVEHCSLILAGTESVFPAISDVFSPVPRQFHRIDVRPFTDWAETRQLVHNPLSHELAKAIAPQIEVLEELHDLCGGDPSEVQLYCHHMYRIVEDGTTSRMELAPRVFREVLHEYRSSAPANLEATINAIERLPDKYLYESEWLSRHTLSLEENTLIETLNRELKAESIFSTDELSAIADELKLGYERLFKDNIVENDRIIRLHGAPFTASYWKSFVKVEKGKRWTWDDKTYQFILSDSLMTAFKIKHEAEHHIILGPEDESVHALDLLRKEGHAGILNSGFMHLFVTVLLSHEHNHEQKLYSAVDVEFQIESPSSRHVCRCRFLEFQGKPIPEKAITDWIVAVKELLASNGVSLTLSTYSRWALPTLEEFHRLGRVNNFDLPEELFGPNEMSKAIQEFNNGNIDTCATMFSRMLKDMEQHSVANNLGFCQILLGQLNDGLENVTAALAKHYDPLYELNRGIALFLMGDRSHADEALSHALDWIQKLDNAYDREHAICVLLLEKSPRSVYFKNELPIDTAILINLWFIGGISKDDLKKKLSEVYLERHQNWDALIEERT